MGARHWTLEETEKLTELWKSRTSVKSVALHFADRSVLSIAQKATDLGLGKMPNAKRPKGMRLPMVLDALRTRGPMHALEIEAYAKIPRSTVLKALKIAHANKDVYVLDWGSNAISGYKPKIWAIGNEEDAPYPQPLSKKEIEHRRIERERKSPELRMKRAAKKKARYWEKRRAQLGVVNSIFSGV